MRVPHMRVSVSLNPGHEGRAPLFLKATPVYGVQWTPEFKSKSFTSATGSLCFEISFTAAGVAGWPRVIVEAFEGEALLGSGVVFLPLKAGVTETQVSLSRAKGAELKAEILVVPGAAQGLKLESVGGFLARVRMDLRDFDSLGADFGC